MAHLTLTYYDQAKQLKAIRQLRPDCDSVNFSMLQALCRRVQRSYDQFFRGLNEWKERKAHRVTMKWSRPLIADH
jgi:hypothetical protein